MYNKIGLLTMQKICSFAVFESHLDETFFFRKSNNSQKKENYYYTITTFEGFQRDWIFDWKSLARQQSVMFYDRDFFLRYYHRGEISFLHLFLPKINRVTFHVEKKHLEKGTFFSCLRVTRVQHEIKRNWQTAYFIVFVVTCMRRKAYMAKKCQTRFELPLPNSPSALMIKSNKN